MLYTVLQYFYSRYSSAFKSVTNLLIDRIGHFVEFILVLGKNSTFVLRITGQLCHALLEITDASASIICS